MFDLMTQPDPADQFDCIRVVELLQIRQLCYDPGAVLRHRGDHYCAFKHSRDKVLKKQTNKKTHLSPQTETNDGGNRCAQDQRLESRQR